MRRTLKDSKKYVNGIMRKQSGFTLLELTVAILILVVIITIAFSIYRNYVDRAKIAIAESALDNAKDNLEAYFTDNAKYPDSINFTDCLDEQGRAVFQPSFCTQLKDSLSTIEGYTVGDKTYTLTARAKDMKQTLIILNPNKITIQGN